MFRSCTVLALLPFLLCAIHIDLLLDRATGFYELKYISLLSTMLQLLKDTYLFYFSLFSVLKFKVGIHTMRAKNANSYNQIIYSKTRKSVASPVFIAIESAQLFTLLQWAMLHVQWIGLECFLVTFQNIMPSKNKKMSVAFS